MAGDRNLVRNAAAAYFGGGRVTTDLSISYQNGPLATYGLGSAWPYAPKGIPDIMFTQGDPAGFGWGAALLVQLPDRLTRRRPEGGMGGPTSGWRGRLYTLALELLVISYEPHVEAAEQGLDDLLDAMEALIYADRTLGTTAATYATGRLITQAGEGPQGIRTQTEPFSPLGPEKHSKYGASAVMTFEALTMVQA